MLYGADPIYDPIPSAAALNAMPAFTMRMRLVSVGETGEKPVGEYTFNHSPS